MTTLKSIPSSTVELLDRNLASSTQLEAPVGLVIGRSYTGPTGAVYVLDDNASASKVYGANSPLLNAATSALKTGVKTVLLYRVGGKPAVLTGFAGPDSVLETVAESTSIADNLRVYQGPSQNDPAVNVLIVFYGASGNRIVYSNVPGSEVDLGYVKVEGFISASATPIGTFDAPVLLSNTLDALASDATQAESLSLGSKLISLTGDPELFHSIDSVSKNGSPISTEYVVIVDGVIKIDTRAAPVGILYPPTGIWFYAANGIDGDAYTVNYKLSSATATFVNGDNGLSSTQKELYEMVDRALRENESNVAQFLYVEGALLDAPNIADGSTATDKLEYLNLTEEEGEYTYEWNTSKVLYKLGTGTTGSIGLADRSSQGQPIVVKSFSEVNFAHRIGVHCFNVTQNEGFVLASVATSVPSSIALKDISKHTGTSPVVDADGVIIANGTGLLGNRFMAGSTTQAQGFFLTNTGFPDGEVVADSGGAPVDLGKHLNIVASVIGTASSFKNAAPEYLGLIASTNIGDGTTNRLIQGVALPFALSKPKLQALMSTRYVVFSSKSDGVRVVSGELATSPYSDYQYVSTSLIIQNLLSRIRNVANPYVGKNFRLAQAAALRTAISSVLSTAAKEGIIEGAAYDIIVVGPGRINIPLQVNVADELRTVETTLSLSNEVLTFE